MHLIEVFVRNPVKVSVGVLLLVLFGIIALFRMPMQLTPEVNIPTLTIETSWFGASPQEVEREIIQEQEEQLKGVEGVNKMTSESMDSTGRITLEFAVGTNMSEALLKVNTRLQQVRQYPIDADEPIIKTANLGDRPIAWFILSPRIPDEKEIADFADAHPHLRPELDKVRKSLNNGVAMYRLRELAEKHPEVKDLAKFLQIDVMKMRRFAEDFIEARFERVEGISDSNVMGGRVEEMQVVVDAEKLAARSLTIADVRNALREQNKDTSGGDFWQGRRRYVVRTLGQYRSPDQVAGTVIGSFDGAPVYVRDVAAVTGFPEGDLGFKKPDGMVRRFGTERIAVNCIRSTGANVLDVMAELQKAVTELNDGVLKQRGLELSQVYDETEYIYSAIGLVNNNIIVGGLLTIAVLLLFLKSGRSTLIIGLAIPTSIIGTFLMLQLMGRSLNVISLAGLAFAVGMLVDNAVVVLENIYRWNQMGHRPFEAAVQGTKEVWGAVLSSSLTTLAVFLPVLFVEEEAGQLFRDIALAISCGIALSLVVSISVIPTAAARLLGAGRRTRMAEAGHAHEAQSNGHLPAGTEQPAPAASPARWSLVGRALNVLLLPVRRFVVAPLDFLGGLFAGLLLGLNSLLQKSLLLRLATVGGAVVGAVFLSWLMMPRVEYLPNGNRNLVFGILLPPPGYNIQQLVDIGSQIEEDLKPYWDLDRDGVETAPLDFPAIGDYFYVARGKQLFLGLRAHDAMRAAELIPLIRQVGGKIPGTFVVASQSSLFEQGLGAGRTIDVEITGPDLVKLIDLGKMVLGKTLASFPKDATGKPMVQVIPKPSLDLSSPEVHVEPKKEQCAAMGMTAQELGYAVDALVDGAYVTDYFLGGKKVDLRILGKESFFGQAQDLDAMALATRTGELVPLRALAYVYQSSGPEQVNHRERERAITIQVSPPPEIPLEQAMQLITQEIVDPLTASGLLENGTYQINLAGTADKLRATWTAMRFNILLALLITYLLMAALFESWLYPLVVICAVPIGAVGGFAGLWLLNLFVLAPLDVLTMLGFVILIGTVVNNPILIVEQSLIHIREDGMSVDDAVLAAVRNRIRPIFMTTTTTLFGLIPLVLFPGAGSELYRGLGAVLLGGLLVSTLVTLIVVPSFFSLVMAAQKRLKTLVFGPEEETPPPQVEKKPVHEPAAS